MPIGRMAAASLALVLAFYLLRASPALALDINPKDYFNISYDPVTFDKSEVKAGEVFHATIKGHAECYKTLPLPVGEATITSQVIAENIASGTRLTLNSGYVISIKPFPDKSGETFEINQLIPLQFPEGTWPGAYRIIGKITEAKAKVTFLWQDVTSYFPGEQNMGVVKCIIPEAKPAPILPPEEIKAEPETQAPPEPPPAATPAAKITTPPKAPTPTANPAPETQESTIPWWVELLIVAAVIAACFGAVRLVRHRRRYS